MYNANNYGYNPYGTYIPQRPMQQPVQQIQQQVETSPVMPVQRPVLNGKQVDSIDVVKALEYPLDGSISYFPLTDGSAIVTKQLGMDGTSRMVIYKPIKEDEKEQPKYLVADDIEDLKEDINEIKREIKDIKKSKKKEE